MQTEKPAIQLYKGYKHDSRELVGVESSELGS